MDPITGITVLAGVTLAGLAGLRLKKSTQEGFEILPYTTPDPTFVPPPGNPNAVPPMTTPYRDSVQTSQTRYNMLTSMINPIANSLIPVGSSDTVIRNQQAQVTRGLGGQTANYTNENAFTLKLAALANKYPIRSDGKGSLYEGISFCREAGKGDNPFDLTSQNGLWKFSEHCGVCLVNGIDEAGQPFTKKQGMYLLPEAREAGNDAKAAQRMPYTQMAPSFGVCSGAPQRPVFATNNDELIYFTKRLACMSAKNIDPDHNCGLCYGTNTYAYVDPDVETQPIVLWLQGTGQAKVTVKGQTVQTITLNETSRQSVVLQNIKEQDSFGVEVTVPSTANLTPSLYGYLQSTNPNGGDFIMPLNVLCTVDDVTGQTPVKGGGFYTFQDKSLEVAKMKPGRGKTSMKLRGVLPFTFLSPDEPSAFDCPTAPYQKTQASLTAFATDQACFKAGSGPGKYSDECLRARILDAGCTNAGDLYKNPSSLNLKDNGAPANLSDIYAKLSGIAAQDMVDARATKQCSGRDITSPCDTFINRSDLAFSTTPGARQCISYLYNNQGKDKSTGATYNAATGYANAMNQLQNLFCLPTGLLNPDTSETAFQTLATIGDRVGGYTDKAGKTFTRVDAIKAYLNDRLLLAIDSTVNPNTNVDRRQAIKDCFGPDLRNIPSAVLTQPQSTSNDCGVIARYVRIVTQATTPVTDIQISQLVVVDRTGKNVATGKTVTTRGQLSTRGTESMPAWAITGVLANQSYPSIYHSESPPSRDSYFQIDLGKDTDVVSVTYYNRGDYAPERAQGQRLQLLDANRNVIPGGERTLGSGAIQTYSFKREGTSDPSCVYNLTSTTNYKKGLFATYYSISRSPPNVNPTAASSGWGSVRGTPGAITSLNVSNTAGLKTLSGAETSVGLVVKGFFVCVTAGTLKLKTNSDDGVYVMFNNQAVINDWNTYAAKDNLSNDIALDSTGIYPIEIRWFQGGGGANITFSWRFTPRGRALGTWSTELSNNFVYI